MNKKIFALAVALALSLLAVPHVVRAQIAPEHTAPYWNAAYWNNKTLTGDPVLTRSDATLDFDWGTGSPQAGVVNPDNFSARWLRYIDTTAGIYRFTVTTDDGMRLWVDDQLLIDAWSDQAATTYTAQKWLAAGHHLVKVEYYENGGLAVAKASWAPVTPNNAWEGSYFANKTLSGSPVLVRNDATIQFDWGTGSPATGVPADNFSVRWTRELDLPAGTYTFSATADDGVRLWVNDHLLIDAWIVQAARTYKGTIFVPAGGADVRMEYFENTGLALAKLSWAPGGDPGTEVIVDDTDDGFVVGGRAASWRTVYEGYDGRSLWTWNNDRVRPAYNWGRWYPDLSAGRYEVFVFVPDRYTTTTQARYWVSHRDGYTLREVNQNETGGQWVSLGTYRFAGNSRDYVSLSDVTYEPYLTRMIAFDAVKWVPRP